MTKRTTGSTLLLFLLAALPAFAQTTYKVGDAWVPSHPVLMHESFVEGFLGFNGSNTPSYLWHTQPLTASPSGNQIYDNILSGSTTWGMLDNCVGTWNADYPSLLPVTPNTLPCVTITAHFVPGDGRWHSGVIASTNPDGTAIPANPTGTLGNRFVLQVLARLPDTTTGQVLQGFTPAIWINNAKAAAGTCTTELDVVEDFGAAAGGGFYYEPSRHCWLAGVDQAYVTAYPEVPVLNPGLTTEVDSITNWHWWILDAKDAKQFVWVRDGKVVMVAPRDPNNGDVSYDAMIANQTGCCSWALPTNQNATATMQVGAIIIR